MGMKFFSSKHKEERKERVSGKRGKWKIAAAAAALLVVAGAVFYINRPQVFHGIFTDDSGLAMVREGKAAGLEKDESRKRELHVLVNDVIGVTNPAYAESEGDRMISALIFEPLMRMDGDGHFTGILAKSVSMSEDGTTCRITLNDKIRFSDGTTLKAEDAAFSIAAMCLTAQEEGSSLYLNIEGAEEFRNGTSEFPSGIEVKDATHLTVRFAVPSPDNVMIAECMIQKRPDDMDGGMVLTLQQLSTGGTGTGAYVKEAGRDGGNTRLTASAYYHENIQDIKIVEFIPYGTYALADAISRGEIDVAVLNGNGESFDSFYDAKQYTIYEKPVDSVLYLLVNLDSGLLRRTNARRAAALSIDRDELTKGALSKYLMTAQALAWENSSLAGSDMPTYDTKTAKELLNGVLAEMENPSAKLVLPVLAGNEIQLETAKAVKSGLERTGFSVEVTPMSQSDYLKQVYMLGNYDLLLTSSGGWQNPASYRSLVENTQGLTTASANETLQASIQSLMEVYDWESMQKAIKETNTVINQTMPVIPVAREKKFVAVSADLQGYKMSQYDAFIHNVWEIRVK